jgi:ribosomal protein S18 acetylase RimI-like enzyme
MSWVFQDESRRLARVERSFAQYFRHLWLGRGALHTTDRLAGAALWLPPDGWKTPMGIQLRLLPGMVLNVRRELPRFIRFFSIVEEKHPHEPHWYLNVLGVHPDLQGRGFGSHLMQPVLSRCDEQGLPAFLETDTERNVMLYERHGFRVTEEFNLPDGGPPMWLMWREPKPAAAPG